jgi:hypothetical protein
MAEHQDAGVIVQGFFTMSSERIEQLGLRHRLPSISSRKAFAEAEGLFAYGASQIELAGGPQFYAARILGGAKPAGLPVEQPTKFELVINLKTAKALGLTIPPSLAGVGVQRPKVQLGSRRWLITDSTHCPATEPRRQLPRESRFSQARRETADARLRTISRVMASPLKRRNWSGSWKLERRRSSRRSSRRCGRA